MRESQLPYILLQYKPTCQQHAGNCKHMWLDDFSWRKNRPKGL